MLAMIWSEYLLPCLCVFLACIGFTQMFNIHGVGTLICAVGGSLGWLIYLLAGSTIFAAFLAAAAIGMGGNVRVGFEDNLNLARGVPARSNGELVAKVVRIANELGREIASPDEARKILSLTK